MHSYRRLSRRWLWGSLALLLLGAAPAVAVALLGAQSRLLLPTVVSGEPSALPLPPAD